MPMYVHSLSKRVFSVNSGTTPYLLSRYCTTRARRREGCEPMGYLRRAGTESTVANPGGGRLIFSITIILRGHRKGSFSFHT